MSWDEIRAALTPGISQEEMFLLEERINRGEATLEEKRTFLNNVSAVWPSLRPQETYADLWEEVYGG